MSIIDFSQKLNEKKALEKELELNDIRLKEIKNQEKNTHLINHCVEKLKMTDNPIHNALIVLGYLISQSENSEEDIESSKNLLDMVVENIKKKSD